MQLLYLYNPKLSILTSQKLSRLLRLTLLNSNH